MYYILLLSQMSCCQIFLGATSEVSISIASSSKLRSLPAIADLDGGSTYSLHTSALVLDDVVLLDRHGDGKIYF